MKSTLSSKQIEEKIKAMYKDKTERTLVFWYDESALFSEEIEHLRLDNVKIHHLNHRNTFYTKILLERKDTDSNYLIYAPFERPANRENHLADTILYSEVFFADRYSILAEELNISQNNREFLKEHKRFFNAKERIRKFKDLLIDYYDEESIKLGILAVLSKSESIQFEEILRIVLQHYSISDEEILEEFSKYNVVDEFWKQLMIMFDYNISDPSLEDFSNRLFMTYMGSKTQGRIPQLVENCMLSKVGTVGTFINQLMNNKIYQEDFNALAEKVYKNINAISIINSYDIEDLIRIDLFPQIDEAIIEWLVKRLENEDLNRTVQNKTLPEICRERTQMHYGEFFINEYNVLRHGYHLVNVLNFVPEDTIGEIINQYTKEGYRIDAHYRKFYYYLAKVRQGNVFEVLKELVENIYTKHYLDVIIPKFNKEFNYGDIRSFYRQRHFYRNFIDNSSEKIIVFISDAFRYEIGMELVKELKKDPKVASVDITPQIGVIPSTTKYGMAALLPNNKLELCEDGEVLVDGKTCNNLNERIKILQKKNPNATAIRFDTLNNYNRDQKREFFIGKSLVYIYHDQIDARGDDYKTEDEVFTASKEAVEEIRSMIMNLTGTLSWTKYFVTADHGFIYRRRSLEEVDKISEKPDSEIQLNKRFILSYEDQVNQNEIKGFQIKESFGSDDGRTVYVPVFSNIFKTAGGGQNYVHGGSSPQEIILPVINVKTIKGKVELEKAKIMLISTISKLSFTSVDLEFIQQDSIGEDIGTAYYKISFIDNDNNVISNEEIHLANVKSEDLRDRLFKLRFNLKNQEYKREFRYYLQAVDMDTKEIVIKKEIQIDIPML